MLTTIFASALSCMVVLANYNFFNYGISGLYILKKIIVIVLVFLGGLIVFSEIMQGLASWDGIERKEISKSSKDKYLWIGMWAVIVAVNTIILFMAVYPGVLSFDSMMQMSELLSGSYSNHHPFYHTQIIHLWIDIGMLLKMLNVSQPDTIESLSIPAQQIARVIVDGYELTEEERALLEQVVYIEAIPENYIAHISDTIKEAVRYKGNQEYIETNKLEFLKLYLKLGLKYPKTYIKAWVDQTRGYWNSGYDYWRWTTNIQENDLGIQRTVNSGTLELMLRVYLYIWETEPILQPFISIGLHTWILILCLYNALIKGKKANIFILVPFLAVIATLLIATPVFSEFRYVYAVFCGMPFVIIISLSQHP